MPSVVQKQYRQVVVPLDPVSPVMLVAAGNWAVVGWNLINPNTTNAYLKIFNSATAEAVTLGTTTPVDTICIPGSGTSVLSNQDTYQIGCNLGICIACVTEIADSGTTAPGTGCYVQLLYNVNE